ncbi:hypothetical protein D1872_223360 [compost metagenome]
MMTDIKGERLQIIDGIRGLSLAGILMANMLIFQYGIWGKEEIHLYSPSKMDSVAYTFTKIFIEGSYLSYFVWHTTQKRSSLFPAAFLDRCCRFTGSKHISIWIYICLRFSLYTI